MLISRLNDEQKEAIGETLRGWLEEDAVTQYALATELKVNSRTVRNMLAGRSLTRPRLEKACAFLGRELKQLMAVEVPTPDMPMQYGGYPRHSVERYFGSYAAVRHSLDRNPNLHRSYFSFDWHEERQAMRFLEHNKFVSREDRLLDYSQAGFVHISADIGLLHLMTCWRGAVRLITLSKLRLNSGMMYGAVLTQADQKFGYMPATTPIVFKKLDDRESLHPEAGQVTPSDVSYEDWQVKLSVAEYEYVIACSVSETPTPSTDVVRLREHLRPR